MYLTQKIKPSMVTCEKTNNGQSNAEPSAPSCSSLRCWLLFWGSLRLAVSVLWTGVMMIMTYQTFDYYWYQKREREAVPSVLAFGVVAAVLQLLEFGMIITFMVAGIKKSASLYRVYYRYCILTLTNYILAVVLVLALDYENGHYFGAIYISYHIDELPIVDDDDLFGAFGVAAILNICFELLLINLIKRLIQKYSYVENSVTCEKV